MQAIYGFMLFIALTSSAMGDFFINVGNHDLLPNTPNQDIDIFLTSSSNSDPELRGMNFRVVLGVGSGNQGVFAGTPGTLEGARFIGGSYFWDPPGPSVSIGGVNGEAPVAGSPAVADVSITIDGSGKKSVGTAGPVRIATLRVSTIGLFSGQYAIDLLDNALTGVGRMQLIVDGGIAPEINAGASNFTVTNGTFTITAVPEPSSMLLVATVGAGGLAVRRWKKRKAQPA